MTFPSLPFFHTLVLGAATFFGTVVYGFALLFAAVIMPGLNALEDDVEYLRAFQVMDGRIQNNEPWFIWSWVASMILAIALAVLTFRLCDMPLHRRLTMVAVCVAFLVGHFITVTQNIPRNNALHALDLTQTNDASTLAAMRQDFAGPWCAYNVARTILFGLASLYWLVELTRVDPNVVFAKNVALTLFDHPPEVEARFHTVV